MAIPFLLLRHGQTTWNAEQRWQGWADSPLSDLGRRQAVDSAEHLHEHGFTRVAASDLSRARDTAALVASALGIADDVVCDPALRERHVGAFEGKTRGELLLEFPSAFDPTTGRLLAIPEGESDDDLWHRAVPALLSLTEQFPEERLLVVSHGGLIRSLERHLGVDPGDSTPNLGGRWLSVEGDRLVPGERFVPVDPTLVTEPPTE